MQSYVPDKQCELHTKHLRPDLVDRDHKSIHVGEISLGLIRLCRFGWSERFLTGLIL
jgi:hypothetical protein